MAQSPFSSVVVNELDGDCFDSSLPEALASLVDEAEFGESIRRCNAAFQPTPVERYTYHALWMSHVLWIGLVLIMIFTLPNPPCDSSDCPPPLSAYIVLGVWTIAFCGLNYIYRRAMNGRWSRLRAAVSAETVRYTDPQRMAQRVAAGLRAAPIRWSAEQRFREPGRRCRRLWAIQIDPADAIAFALMHHQAVPENLWETAPEGHVAVNH